MFLCILNTYDSVCLGNALMKQRNNAETKHQIQSVSCER